MKVLVLCGVVVAAQEEAKKAATSEGVVAERWWDDSDDLPATCEKQANCVEVTRLHCTDKCKDDLRSDEASYRMCIRVNTHYDETSKTLGNLLWGGGGGLSKCMLRPKVFSTVCETLAENNEETCANGTPLGFREHDRASVDDEEICREGKAGEELYFYMGHSFKCRGSLGNCETDGHAIDDPTGNPLWAHAQHGLTHLPLAFSCQPEDSIPESVLDPYEFGYLSSLHWTPDPCFWKFKLPKEKCAVGGWKDPHAVTEDGKNVDFYLPADTWTTLMSTDTFDLKAHPVIRKNSKQQWIDGFEITHKQSNKPVFQMKVPYNPLTVNTTEDLLDVAEISLDTGILTTMDTLYNSTKGLLSVVASTNMSHAYKAHHHETWPGVAIETKDFKLKLIVSKALYVPGVRPIDFFLERYDPDDFQGPLAEIIFHKEHNDTTTQAAKELLKAPTADYTIGEIMTMSKHHLY